MKNVSNLKPNLYYKMYMVQNDVKTNAKRNVNLCYVSLSFVCLFRFSSSCVNIPVFRSAFLVVLFDDFGLSSELELFNLTIDLRLFTGH